MPAPRSETLASSRSPLDDQANDDLRIGTIFRHSVFERIIKQICHCLGEQFPAAVHASDRFLHSPSDQNQLLQQPVHKVRATSCISSLMSNSANSATCDPASTREIINSALNVLISWSESAMISAKSFLAFIFVQIWRESAASALLRKRVSGVFRSWAIESETSRRPLSSRVIRSSITFMRLDKPVKFVIGTNHRQAVRMYRRPECVRWILPPCQCV